MKLNDLQASLINNFLNLLLIEIANSYLNQLKTLQENEVDEIVLKFLDHSVYLAEAKIDIASSSFNEKIVKMPERQKIKFQLSMAKHNSYKELCEMLNFVYAIIKEEKKQLILIKNLYNWYDEKYLPLEEKQKIILSEEIKPWLIKNSKFYQKKWKITTD